MTAPASFKQADVARLIRGALKAGCKEEMIRLTVSPDGTLSLAIQRPAENDDERDSSWDDA
ncbi:hypothetical protein [Novosphingobium sp. KN65.2]|uniref:hypothetical protein n=1 Tax=Novosphingobium sp. KN65.2 TaxID=1478134 RepID=UPI0005DB93AC|nr:hypothetical protein [Novosphingobium sp. KN65.2]CDO37637.1 conserved hypothetical protein [Novosphingobium sp. KN65.2]